MATEKKISAPIQGSLLRSSLKESNSPSPWIPSTLTFRPSFSMTIERGGSSPAGVAAVPGLASTVIRALAPPAAPGGLASIVILALGPSDGDAASGLAPDPGAVASALAAPPGSAATAAGCASAGEVRCGRATANAARRASPRTTRRASGDTVAVAVLVDVAAFMGAPGGIRRLHHWTQREAGSDSRPVPDAPPRPGGSVRQVGTACYYSPKGAMRVEGIARCAFVQVFPLGPIRRDCFACHAGAWRPRRPALTRS